MGLNETRDRFREMLPDELKGAHVAAIPDDERERLLSIREAVLQAFEEAAPKPQPAVRIQTVDECVGPGEYRRTFEVVDTRIPGKSRIVAEVATREEAEARRQKAYLIPVGGGKRVRPIGGAAYTYAAVDADEYWHDTDVETIASMHTYGVISGCTVTADAANMTVDLAAGTIYHSSSSVTVAGGTDAYTLVADGTNERWAALTVSSAGSAVLVSGDPAASASSEPAKPEIGDRVIVAFAKIQAAQTIAANVEYLLDKRVITHAPSLTVYASDAEVSTAGTGSVTLKTISSLSIAAGTRFTITGTYRKSSGSATASNFGLTINATAVLSDAANPVAQCSATNQAEDGYFRVEGYAGDATHTGALTLIYQTRVTATGANAQAYAGTTTALTAPIPAATITSIAITCNNGNASQTSYLSNLRVTVYPNS